MSSTNRTQALPWIALGAVYILWGSTFLGIRVAVETIPPFLMAGVRYMLAGALLTLVVAAFNRDAWRTIRVPQWRSLVSTAFLLLVCGNGLLCYAEMQLPAGVASLIVATVPIWMVLVAAFADRTRIARGAWIGLALGTAGIAALAGVPGGHIPLVPTLLVLFGSLAWAIGSVYARRDAALRANPLIPSLEMFCGGVMLSIVALALGEARDFHPAAVSAASLYGFLWLVGPGAIVGYSAYVYAVRTLPTSIVATYAYVNPIVAVIFGALLLHEPLTLNVLAGGAFIVLAVVAILRAGGARRRATEEPSRAPDELLEAKAS